MTRTKLEEVFEHLSQHSADSVQNGVKFSEWDEYMHVDRPIEDTLIGKMDEIDKIGGGIILLVGSAGDGKSHLISRIKQMSDWGESCFYNDATASCSPQKTAVDTLKEALVPFNDKNLSLTTRKMVLAINLGKLNAFIEDNEVKTNYTEIVRSTLPIFDDNSSTAGSEAERVKVIVFSDEQLFEFHPDWNKDYPVDAPFLSSILDKIVKKSNSNMFYKAYKEDKANPALQKDPLLLNYELLLIPEVRHTICMTIIEAIVKCKLNITPREFLDFIYSIMVYPAYDAYDEKKNFYEALLPTLLYCGTSNTIQKAITILDPLKHSSTEHDKQLSVLFTSYSIPKDYLNLEISGAIPEELINRTNQFYDNNGHDIERTTKFLFRLRHLLSYHSEDMTYIEFLSLLRGVFNDDINWKKKIFSMVSRNIPRHYGSYYSKTDMIPLNIQGGRYRMFAHLKLKPKEIKKNFDKKHPSKFLLRFDLEWDIHGKTETLRVDYQLFSYLHALNDGRLALTYENEKDLAFSRFVRSLAEQCDCSEEITIVQSDSKEMKLVDTGLDIELS